MRNIVANTEDKAMVEARAHQSIAAASGTKSWAMAREPMSIAAASGNESRAVANDRMSIAAASGEGALAVAEIFGGIAAATGDQGVAKVIEQRSAAVATARYGTAVADRDGVAISIGYCGRARAGVGGVIVLCQTTKEGDFVAFRVGRIGQDHDLWPNTLYTLDFEGNFVEVEDSD